MATQEETPRYTARLLIDCADQPGIVAAVSGFLFERGANIVSSHQYSSDPIGGRFYLRTEFFLEGLAEERERFKQAFLVEVAQRFAMEWEIRWWGERQRLAILVSRHDHCLVDLLWRWRRGELDADVVAVVSNHPDLADEAQAAGVPFYHVPVAAEAKGEAERADARHPAQQGRPDRAGALHASPQRGVPGRAGGARDQHPPFLLACLCGRQPLSQGTRARCQADRRNGPLRDR